MNKPLSILSLLLCFCFFLQAQTPIPAGINPDNIKPEDIPDAETLKQMGASAPQIQEAMELKETQSDGKEEQVTEIAEEKQQEVVENIQEKSQNIIEEKVEDVQEIVQESGIPLPSTSIFGQQFFRQRNLQFFENANRIKAPANYILGAGDEVTITVWGFSHYSENFTISPDGFIHPGEAGRIYLKGLRFNDAKSLIRSRFGSFLDLANSKLDVTLTYSRVITVNIIGEVLNPGAYKIPAINTAFNALIAANGPNDIGSLRNIYVKRNGRTVAVLDVYDYLLNPETNRDQFLEDNDFIFVPPQERVVRISGEIQKENRFELKKGENLTRAIEFAGGMKPTTYTRTIQLTRYKNNREFIEDINLDSLNRTEADYTLEHGDNIIFYRVPEGIENYIKVEGAVRLPARYEFEEGMQLTDVFAKAEGFEEEAYLERGYVVRTLPNKTKQYLQVNYDELVANKKSDQNLELQKFDVVHVFSKDDFRDEYIVKIQGAVRSPGDFPYGDSLKLRDMVYFAGGIKPDAVLSRAYILRSYDNFTKEYIPVNLGNALADENSADNIKLERKDEITIFSEETFTDTYDVEVIGAVRKPGIFVHGTGMTLKDALFYSGGLRPEAANKLLEISRVMNFEQAVNQSIPTRTIIKTVSISQDLKIDAESEQFQLEPLDQVFVRTTAEFELQQNVLMSGEVMYPGTYTLKSKNERILDVLERAGGLSSIAYEKGINLEREEDNVGFIIVDMKRARKRPNSRFNYILRKGDKLNVPKVKQFVSLSGAVNYPDLERIGKINAPYKKGKRAGHYIRQFGGGFDKNAKKKATFVQYQNGRIKRTKEVFWANVYPKVKDGSAILVVENEKKEKQEKEGEKTR